jgi:hypothetical protein
MVLATCRATIGTVGNEQHELIIGKAGRKRYAGQRPHVRGSVMNPNDHPHGGGEGKATSRSYHLLFLHGVRRLLVRRLVHTRLVQTNLLFVVVNVVHILVNYLIRSNPRGGT